jgi:hypothetical protein
MTFLLKLIKKDIVTIIAQTTGENQVRLFCNKCTDNRSYFYYIKVPQSGYYCRQCLPGIFINELYEDEDEREITARNKNDISRVEYEEECDLYEIMFGPNINPEVEIKDNASNIAIVQDFSSEVKIQNERDIYDITFSDGFNSEVEFKDERNIYEIMFSDGFNSEIDIEDEHDIYEIVFDHEDEIEDERKINDIMFAQNFNCEVEIEDERDIYEIAFDHEDEIEDEQDIYEIAFDQNFE